MREENFHRGVGENVRLGGEGFEAEAGVRGDERLEEGMEGLLLGGSEGPKDPNFLLVLLLEREEGVEVGKKRDN